MNISEYVKNAAARSGAVKELKAEIDEVRNQVAEQADALIELADIIAGGNEDG